MRESLTEFRVLEFVVGCVDAGDRVVRGCVVFKNPVATARGSDKSVLGVEQAAGHFGDREFLVAHKCLVKAGVAKLRDGEPQLALVKLGELLGLELLGRTALYKELELPHRILHRDLTFELAAFARYLEKPPDKVRQVRRRVGKYLGHDAALKALAACRDIFGQSLVQRRFAPLDLCVKPLGKLTQPDRVK